MIMKEQLFDSMPRYAVYRKGKKQQTTLTICRWDPASERQHLHPEYLRFCSAHGPLAWVLAGGNLVPADAIENFCGYSF
jgi:hypothetical protein